MPPQELYKFVFVFNGWCRPEWWRSSELGPRARARASGGRFEERMRPSTSFPLASLSPFLGVSIAPISRCHNQGTIVKAAWWEQRGSFGEWEIAREVSGQTAEECGECQAACLAGLCAIGSDEASVQKMQ